MRRLSTDDLSPLGMKIFTELYTQEETRRPRCSRIDYVAGFIDLAIHHKLRVYFNLSDDMWATILKGGNL